MPSQLPTKTEEYKRFFEYIGECLENRDGEITYNSEYDCPEYVIEMCTEIKEMIEDYHNEANITVDVEKLLKADRMASGHVDYQRKFALYCYEIFKYGETDYA